MQVAPAAVQYLELTPIRPDLMLGGKPPRPINHCRIVRRDGRVVSLGEKPLDQPHVRRVHFRFPLIRDLLRLLIGPFDQPDPGFERHYPPGVLVGSIEIGLQDDAHVAVALAPEGLEDLQRDIGIPRALYVDPNEEPFVAIEELAEVVDRACAVHVEAKLRQLQRQIAADARLQDRADDPQVLPRRVVGFGKAANILAEVIERVEEVSSLDLPGGGDGLRRGFTGNEPAREAGRLPHAVP